MRYWHHPESSCVFITEDHDEAGIECVELEHDEFLKWKEHYKQQPCRWCGDTGYFYSQADLGYCNCEAGTLKIFEDHKDLLG